MNKQKAVVRYIREGAQLAALAITLATTMNAVAAPSEGVSAERLQRIHEMIQRDINAKQYSGAVALVARNGHTVYFEAQGLMDIEVGKPMAKDAVFRLASMSKVVTAVAVSILVEEGKIRLDDPVSRFIPEFKDLKVAVPDPGQTQSRDLPQYSLVPAHRAITVRDLLTHSSGLGSGPISEAELAKLPQSPNGDLAAEVDRYARVPLDFQPGAQFAYSGLAGFDTLGRIVEIASGMNLEKFFQERVFLPLGMTSTTFIPSDALRSRLVTLYTRTADGLQKDANQNIAIDPVCFRGAAGLVGTVEDYYRFAQMLANGGQLGGKRILSPRMVEMIGSAQLHEGFAGLPPGCGWGLGVRYIANGPATGTLLSSGSYGWSGAWGTHFWIDPAQKLVAVLMLNETTAGGAGAVSARDFETAVMQSLTTLHK